MPPLETDGGPTAAREHVDPGSAVFAPDCSAPVSNPGRASVDWDDLYEQLSSADKRREMRTMQREAEEAALAEYERWAAEAVASVMSDLKQAAEQRSHQLHGRTGKVLEVEYPSGPTITGVAGECEIRFLRLGLGRACVHVYSSHSRGSTTHIHLLPAFADSLQKNHRLVSEPGAFIVRGANDHYELRSFRGDPYASDAQAMSVDMLLYKALRLLARACDGELAR